MGRAIRRHHIERLKKKWRERVLGWWKYSIYMPTEQQLQRHIGIRVNHPRHHCKICKVGAKYFRARAKRGLSPYNHNY